MRITELILAMAVGTGDITNPQNESHKNVLGSTLQLFSKQPLTGFNRDGFCRVTVGDFGNHSVAGTKTHATRSIRIVIMC